MLFTQTHNYFNGDNVPVRYLYISLVGTSVLRNVAQTVKEKWEDKYRDIMFWHNMPLDNPRNTYPEGELCRLNTVEPELYADMVEAARNLREKASAEVAGLVGISSVRGHSRALVEVLLYPTASCTSVLSAKINREVIVDLGFSRVEMKVLEKLGKLETFEEGLVELLDNVVSAVVDARRRKLRVFVNATPGFKAESSFLVLASILAGADGAVYVHETFREPVFIPAVPLKVDESFVGIFKAFMPEGRAPRDVWSYVDLEVRQLLEERGIVKCEKDYCELRPWIKLLVKWFYH